MCDTYNSQSLHYSSVAEHAKEAEIASEAEAEHAEEAELATEGEAGSRGSIIRNASPAPSAAAR